MRIGSGTPSTYYLGSTAVAKICLGATEVWAAAPASAQITSVAMSAQNTTTGNVPVAITASADDTFDWILTSTDPGTSPPSVAQVSAGNGQDGTAAEDSGSVTTTAGTGVLDALTTGLNESLYLVVADVDSVHFDATAEAIDTRIPSLSSPTATAASATSIDAGVTSSLASGEIFFAARLASDPVLSISDIENGTGNAVAIASDATPTADANNAATLTGLTTGTAYDIDSFQRRLGQESAVATSAAATPTAGGITYVDTVETQITSGAGNQTVSFTGALENDIVRVLVATEDYSLNGAPAGWTLVVDNNASPFLSGHQMFWKRMGASPDTSVDVPRPTSIPAACSLAVLRGVNTTTALDVTIPAGVDQFGPSDTITPPSITTATDNALVETFAVLDDKPASPGRVTSFPAGYTNTVEVNAGGAAGQNCTIGLASKIVATAGAESPGAFIFDETDGLDAVTWAWRPA